MSLPFEPTFELLSQEEWNQYLGVEFFDDMIINASVFSNANDMFQSAKFPRLEEMITEHNNKVGSIKVSYALCRHYYDEGIPDDPWWAPKENGKGFQYMPNFSEEHWGRQYWFNFFTSPFYIRMRALWDSVIEIINFFYSYDIEAGVGSNILVLDNLKEDRPYLKKIIDDILNNDIYKNANKYRIAAAHGNIAGEVHDTIKVRTKTEGKVIARDENGEILFENDTPIKKMKISEMATSSGVGEYIDSKTIMDNMNQYAQLTGVGIQQIVGYMITA